MLGLNRPEIEKLLSESTPGVWVAHDGNPDDSTSYLGYPRIEREPTGAPDDSGELLATCFSLADARLMAAAPALARQCLALLDRAEAAEKARDEELWMHAACLSIAEGATDDVKVPPESWSLAMRTVWAGRMACKEVRVRVEAAERDRDRLAVLVRAALNGKLAGPWVRVDAKHDAWARTGAAVCWAGSVTTEDRTFKGTRDDADAKLIAHGWTLMDEADAKLIAGGSDAD
jgi:hypothetical protein